MQKHPKAQIVVFARGPQGLEVLLFQMNEKRGGFWQNITGTVEKNESYFMGALREFHEETGFDYDQIQGTQLLKSEFTFQDQYKREVREVCFAVLLKEKKNPTLDPHEHQSFKWVPIEKITADHYKYPSNFTAFEEAKKRW